MNPCEEIIVALIVDICINKTLISDRGSWIENIVADNYVCRFVGGTERDYSTVYMVTRFPPFVIISSMICMAYRSF
jgi:hypothetical protein